MRLLEQLDELAYDTAFDLAGLRNPAMPISEMGRLGYSAAEKLRAVAISVLLTKGDADAFYHNLIRSGLIRVAYLKKVADLGVVDDHHNASGRTRFIVDVIAAADFSLAQQIATLSPNYWRQGHEYEDDYCYAQLLHRLLFEPLSMGECDRLMDQYAVYLDGQPCARLAVIRAICAVDQVAFDEAFDALLFSRRREIDAAKERGQLEEPPVVAERLVYIDALALLRLAERRGLITQRDYIYCPSLARVAMKKPFPGE